MGQGGDRLIDGRADAAHQGAFANLGLRLRLVDVAMVLTVRVVAMVSAMMVMVRGPVPLGPAQDDTGRTH